MHANLIILGKIKVRKLRQKSRHRIFLKSDDANQYFLHQKLSLFFKKFQRKLTSVKRFNRYLVFFVYLLNNKTAKTHFKKLIFQNFARIFQNFKNSFNNKEHWHNSEINVSVVSVSKSTKFKSKTVSV